MEKGFENKDKVGSRAIICMTSFVICVIQDERNIGQSTRSGMAGAVCAALIQQPSALTGLSVSFHPFSTRALWDPCYGDFNRATTQASREDRTAKLERSSQLMRAQLAQLEQAPSVSWPSPLTPLQKCAPSCSSTGQSRQPLLGASAGQLGSAQVLLTAPGMGLHTSTTMFSACQFMAVGHCCAWQAAMWVQPTLKHEHGCTGSLRSEGSVPDTTCGWWHVPPPQPLSLLLKLPPVQPSSLVPAPKDWLQPQVWAARWQRKSSSCARSAGQASGGVARGPSTWCVHALVPSRDVQHLTDVSQTGAVRTSPCCAQHKAHPEGWFKA